MVVPKRVIIIDQEEFDSRLKYFNQFKKIVLATLTEMSECGEIEKDDIETLCLADYTATWVCDRIRHNHDKISFAMKSTTFNNNTSKALKKNGFHEVIYRCTDFDTYVYAKYTIPITELTIVTDPNDDLLNVNMDLTRTYTINVRDGTTSTLDCDCIRNVHSDVVRIECDCEPFFYQNLIKTYSEWNKEHKLEEALQSETDNNETVE
ncbi:lef-12 [Leucania separata nucleopolyhedrovirus]|uniref:Lef-12 n=1 Tax=Leucania separata nucleopolyhedrovirus TaxID=1307956 RepID=Q0IL77_NPVLS|nr:lef-12 [Leucania separata nucleopolyhedrovirus]AAR28806.1 lef-12 [Leucania separata nucleopolyhedrovirus]